MKKMVLVFAHPDDESYCTGATIAKYVKAGWDVDILCATKGEAGGDGEIRRRELEKAATLLGASTITFLGHKDGSLPDEPPGELEDKIYGFLEEYVPDVVVTFDTTGFTNHPDHIKICFATTFAFQKYAFWIEERIKEYSPKLYYACVPETVALYLKKKKIFDEEAFGRPWAGTPDKFVTTVISTKGFELMKKRALKEHKTQATRISRFLSLSTNPLLKQEYFIWRLDGTREVFMGKNDRVSSKF